MLTILGGKLPFSLEPNLTLQNARSYRPIFNKMTRQGSSPNHATLAQQPQNFINTHDSNNILHFLVENCLLIFS